MIAGSEWQKAVRVLEGARSVSLACHVGPDGDALGSMLALGLALRARGCDVHASWGSEPYEVPRTYAFLPGLDLLCKPDALPAEPGLMVTFDAGSFDRLGSLEPNARAASALLVVDHHATNDRFGSINLVDHDAAASAAIVYELLAKLRAPLNEEIATCLYVGLVTDTGRFQYANTTPAVHGIAADLLGHGVRHDEIARTIYDAHTVGYLKLAARALDKISVRANMVWTWITTEDLRATGVGLEETDALIDLVRSTDAADVAAILKQQDDGRFRVSMRSRGGADVGSVCESFGGGGHALAAGFTSENGDPHATIEKIATALQR